MLRNWAPTLHGPLRFCDALCHVWGTGNFFNAACAHLWHLPTGNTVVFMRFCRCLQGPVCPEELQMLPHSSCPACIPSLGWIISPSCFFKATVLMPVNSLSPPLGFGFWSLKIGHLSYSMVCLPWTNETQRLSAVFFKRKEEKVDI